MTVVYGQGINPVKAWKLMEKTGGLADGEEPVFIGRGGSARPLVDYVVVTNLRVIGLSSSGHTYMAPLTQVVSVTFDARSRKLEVVTTDGHHMAFTRIAGGDHQAMQRAIDVARSDPGLPEALRALASLSQSGSTVIPIPGLTDSDYKAAQKESKQALREARDEERLMLKTRTQAVRDRQRDQRTRTSTSGGSVTPTVPGGKRVGNGSTNEVYAAVSRAVETARGTATDESTPEAGDDDEAFDEPGSAADAGDTGAAGPEHREPHQLGVVERLHQLTAMRDRGLISQDEYDTLREKILSSL